MYIQNILDQQAFTRESTILSAIANPYLLDGKVLIAETGIFYNVVNESTEDSIQLKNGKFLVHQPNITINSNPLKGEVIVKANQIPQDENNRFITDLERQRWDNKANKIIEMIAGNGLIGGGNLELNRTFDIVSANDGIIINPDNIQLNLVNDLTNTSITRGLTANQGKILDEKKLNLTGGTLTGLLKSNSDIRTSGKLYVKATTNNVDTTPLVDLAIGDSDTGFKWLSEGNLALCSNNQNIFEIRNNILDVLKPFKSRSTTQLMSTLDVTGATTMQSTLQVARTIEASGDIKTNSSFIFGNNKAKMEFNADNECIEFKFL